MLRARLLFVLAFLGAFVSSGSAQSSAITFFQTGDALWFDAKDVDSVRYVDQDGHGEIAIALTPDMSQRLHEFTGRLIGATVMSVSGGTVLSADVTVRTAVSGPIVHFTGSDKSVMRQLAERLDGLRDAGEQVLATYEQVSKRDIGSPGGTLIEDNFLDGSLRVPVDHDFAGTLETAPNNWLAVVGGQFIVEWSVEHVDDEAMVTVDVSTPALRDMLRPDAGGHEP